MQCYVRQSTESEAARRSSFGRIIEAEPPVSPRGTTDEPLPNSASTQSQLGNGSGLQNNQYVNVTVDPQRPKPPPLPSNAATSNFSAETLPPTASFSAAAQYENVNVGAAMSPLSQQPPQMIVASEDAAFDDENDAKEATNFQINYATLELSPVEANNNQNSDSDEGHVQKDIETEGQEGAIRPRDYALIDFDRTQALSQAVRPLQRDGRGGECAQESGIRKTRHNSTLESICTLQT